MFEKLRDPLSPLINYVAKFFTWMHPNTISIIGFILGFIPIYFFINGNPRLAGLGLLMHLFDTLDGAVARHTGKVSRFGEVLDASLDRITDGLIIFSIAQGGFVNWNFAIIVLIGFYMVSYVRARTGEAAAKEVKLNVGFAQRGERVVILMLASILFIDKITLPALNLTFNSIELVFAILAVLTWQTAIFRLITAYRKLKG